MQVRNRVHVAMIPTPGMGHLIPLTELARRLTESHNISVTFILPSDGSPISNSALSLLNSLPKPITHVFLPPVDVSDLPEHAAIETRIILTLTRSIPRLSDSLRVMAESTRLVAIVTDHFGFPVFELAQQFGALPYLFFPTSGLGLCFGFKLPILDKTYTCEYRDLPEPVRLCPGSVPVYGSDFIDPAQDRNDEAYKGLLHMLRKFHDVAGIFVNSFPDLEPAAFKYLMDDEVRERDNFPPVYPVGPIIKTGFGSETDGGSCVKWLDEQPRGSVLFVSFGSGGSLSHDQIVELAYGLELSGVRFLWVVKSPHDKIANANFFKVDSVNDPLDYLPRGFLERTEGVGLVVPSWAPQVRVLSHDSVGGFLTHCGWNSILEGIVHGTPMVAWPLFAEQKFNAVLLAEDLKVALRVKPNQEGLVKREQIVEYARSLILGEEGKVMRDRMSKLKDKANLALSEGGSSEKSLDKVVQVWMIHNSQQ
ncbi:hydroquinone glucosyltransferase-like [Silene latifolia]|uniref:hydroquinone glucosyltransferase-like n=1 Tax=Silene latifolia TaxID=37657 RepID=UPI003D77833B